MGDALVDAVNDNYLKTDEEGNVEGCPQCSCKRLKVMLVGPVYTVDVEEGVSYGTSEDQSPGPSIAEVECDKCGHHLGEVH